MRYLMILFISLFLVQPATPTAQEIIARMDANMTSKNRVSESKMVIHGKRKSRTLSSKSWTEGDARSLTEYLAPAREAGTKMLKLEDKLWIYSPESDRIIQISGHMLQQSVMGSDLSYEDMMEDRGLLDVYDPEITGESVIDGRKCYELTLTAKVSDVAYQTRKTWIDQERYIPLKEELYAKSGELLKKTVFSNVAKIEGRWFPKTILYKDMLKEGKGTEFIVEDISFDQQIPEHLFSKAALKE